MGNNLIFFAGWPGKMGSLEKEARYFFKTYGSLKLLGPGIWKHIVSSPPSGRFETFLSALGYKGDPTGFFCRVFELIEKRKPVVINQIRVPVIFLVWVLEKVYPHDRVKTITDPDQIHFLVSGSENREIEKVLDLYPVRLSGHAIRQCMVSKAVCAQYLPCAEELDPWGFDTTFEGHSEQGIIEQMYRNRVIFLLGMACPVYCRFCFRKHKSLRKKGSPKRPQILEALSRVQADQNIREVLITGGEPFLYRKNLETALDGIGTIDHIRVVRIATRSVSYFPRLFLKNKARLVRFLEEKHGALKARGKSMEIGVHFIHPDEISVQSLEILTRLAGSGIRVYLQTPFLKGINNEDQVLKELFSSLRNAGVDIYYIFTPCHPIRGTRKFQTSIGQAVRVYTRLRACLSDRAMPKLCTATSLGKMEWGTSGWAVEGDPETKSIWIRTPYTFNYFNDFIRNRECLPHVRENPEGTLDVRMLARAGNPEIFTGIRILGRTKPDRVKGALAPSPLGYIREKGLENLVRPKRALCRTHLTRLETHVGEKADVAAYAKSHPKITDAVIHGIDLNDPDPGLERARDIVRNLGKLDHMACIRIGFTGFSRYPEKFDPALARRLAKWGRPSLSNPLRIEMETWFARPEEISEKLWWVLPGN